MKEIKIEAIGVEPPCPLGQPYDIPNTLAASRIVKWKVVLTYAVLALLFSIVAGLIYGLLVGGL